LIHPSVIKKLFLFQHTMVLLFESDLRRNPLG
jgi:hypothetical protein